MATDLKVSSLACKRVFYKPENRKKLFELFQNIQISVSNIQISKFPSP